MPRTKKSKITRDKCNARIAKLKAKMAGPKTIGNKQEVWAGKAKKTSGGLTQGDLMKNNSGRVVSKAKHALGLKNAARLKKFQFAS